MGHQHSSSFRHTSPSRERENSQPGDIARTQAQIQTRRKNTVTSVHSSSGGNSHKKLQSKQSLNVHEVQPDIKIHSVASEYLDPDHESAMTIPLGEVTDEQLLAEVARRRLDIHHNITESLVRESYVFESHIGHGASGEVFLVTNRFSNEKFACKVVRKDSTINDAKSMSTEIEIMKRIRHRHIVSLVELYEVMLVHVTINVHSLILCNILVAEMFMDHIGICQWGGLA